MICRDVPSLKAHLEEVVSSKCAEKLHLQLAHGSIHFVCLGCYLIVKVTIQVQEGVEGYHFSSLALKGVL
jgi:hypothetical protein